MKTLQEEIIEALCDARTANFYLPTVRDKYDKLAAKVEYARCENCEYWETDQDPGSGECIHKNNNNSELFDNKDAFSLNWADMEFGCWHFEPKVKDA